MSGSLLEFALGEISVPVGRVQYLNLHPMTFCEYPRGIGNDVAAEAAAQHPSTVDVRERSRAEDLIDDNLELIRQKWAEHLG